MIFMKKREQGILTVEASAILTVVLLCILFLFSFSRVYRAQNMVSHATLQSADAVAIESYLRETALQTDAQDVVNLASMITESSSISAESLESLRSANLPKIAKQKFVAAIAETEAEADKKLRLLGVKDGIAGIDFSESKMDLANDDVIVAITYTIEMQFPVFGADEMTVTKSAKAKTFGEILFEVSTEPNVPGWGTTTGDDKVVHGSTVTITAVPNYGYKFVSWNDGVTDNPRTVTVTDAQHYVAIFEKEAFGVNIRNKIEYNHDVSGITHRNYGSFTGAATYLYLDNAVLKATPTEHYEFKGWDIDGNGTIDNENQTMTLVVDKTYNHIQAVFKPKIYTVSVKSNNTTFGTALVSQSKESRTLLQVEYGSKVTLNAALTNSTLYRFVKWSDNDRNATRTVTVLSNNVTYTANFEHNTCTVKFYNGDIEYHSTQVIIGSSISTSDAVSAAMPAKNPERTDVTFKEWNCNGTTFTNTTKVSQDISVKAKYQYTVTFTASGNGHSYSKSLTANVGDGIKMPNPTEKGSDFSGWSGNGTDYTPGSSYTINKNVTLTGTYSCNHSNGFSGVQEHRFYCRDIHDDNWARCKTCNRDCRPSGVKHSYNSRICTSCGAVSVTEERQSWNIHYGISGRDYNISSELLECSKASGQDDFEAACKTKHTYGYVGPCWNENGKHPDHPWGNKRHILCSYCHVFEQPPYKRDGKYKYSYWCGKHLDSDRDTYACPF